MAIVKVSNGSALNVVPELLGQYEEGNGHILGEFEARELLLRNFDSSPYLLRRDWSTATLSATKGDEVLVILPYEIDSNRLTSAAEYALTLIDESHIDPLGLEFGINLEKDHYNSWKILKSFSSDASSGVYWGRRSKSGDDPKEFFACLDWGNLSLEEAVGSLDSSGCSILLTKLGHPDYVHERFAHDKEEVHEMIRKSFRIGRMYGLEKMFGQQLPPVSDRAQLSTWNISALNNGFSSDAAVAITSEHGGFLFQQSP